MRGLLYIEQADDGPLCPNTGDPRHLLAVKMLDAMYEVMDRDPETSESPPDQDRLYSAAAKAASSWMHLYLATSTPSVMGQGKSHALAGTHVEAWYFRCPTCEFMIPAQGIRRSGR